MFFWYYSVDAIFSHEFITIQREIRCIRGSQKKSFEVVGLVVLSVVVSFFKSGDKVTCIYFFSLYVLDHSFCQVADSVHSALCNFEL